jgi:hypothetical protein
MVQLFVTVALTARLAVAVAAEAVEAARPANTRAVPPLTAATAPRNLFARFTSMLLSLVCRHAAQAFPRLTLLSFRKTFCMNAANGSASRLERDNSLDISGLP